MDAGKNKLEIELVGETPAIQGERQEAVTCPHCKAQMQAVKVPIAFGEKVRCAACFGVFVPFPKPILTTDGHG